MRISAAKNILLIIVSLFIGILIVIGCAEIIFFIQYGDWYRNKGLHIRQKKVMGIVNDKNLVYEYNQSLLHKAPAVDSALREYVELINFEKKKDIYRILCIGGSTTRGITLKYSETYPAILDSMLNNSCPEKFEVFNLGLQSATTWDFIQRYNKASTDADFGWKDLDPDLVIIAPVWNDLGTIDVWGETYIIGGLNWKKLLENIKKNFSSRCALGFYVYKTVSVIYERRTAKFHNANSELFLKGIESAKPGFRRRVSQIINLWKKKGVKIYLVTFPVFIEEEWSTGLLKDLLKPNYPASYLPILERSILVQKADCEIISLIAKKYRVTYFNLSYLAKGVAPFEKVKLFIDGIHMGPTLNHQIAQILFKKITTGTE